MIPGSMHLPFAPFQSIRGGSVMDLSAFAVPWTQVSLKGRMDVVCAFLYMCSCQNPSSAIHRDIPKGINLANKLDVYHLGECDISLLVLHDIDYSLSFVHVTWYLPAVMLPRDCR